MKSLQTIFKYIKNYPSLVAAYFGFNILSATFGVVSLGLVSPFLMLIFKQGDTFKIIPGSGATKNPINLFKEKLYVLLQSPGGSTKALIILCLVIFVAIILKNFCAYMSTYFLNPIRNRILNDMRRNMYQKILQLPVGYFSDKRKGML